MRSQTAAHASSSSSAVGREPEGGSPAGQDRAWHAASPQEALDALQASVDGLSEEEAGRRLEVYGPNRLPQGRRRSALLRFVLQFHNLLIYVLLAASALAAAIGHATDALVILASWSSMRSSASCRRDARRRRWTPSAR